MPKEKTMTFARAWHKLLFKRVKSHRCIPSLGSKNQENRRGDGRIFPCLNFCSTNIWGGGTLSLIVFFKNHQVYFGTQTIFKVWFSLKINTKSPHCYFLVIILQSCSIVLRFFFSPDLLYTHVFLFVFFFNNLIEKN